MKKIIFTVCLLMAAMFLIAQEVPQAINFQAIARDANSEIMANTQIMIQLTILDGSPQGTQVYREIRSLTTNAYGSFSFQIGREPYIAEGVFADVDWVGGRKFLKIDYDPTNSLAFDLTLGTIEFVSVPYAFAAGSVSYIDATGANDGDVLAYNATTGRFEPRTVEGGGAGTYTTPNLMAVLAEGNSAGYATISNLAAPVNANDAATKAYVDGLVAQLQAAINNLGGGGTVNGNVPTVTASEATGITAFRATLSGEVTSSGNSPVTVRGFMYGTDSNNLMQSVQSGSGTGSFTETLTGLADGTTYYYKAYATNSEGTGSSEVMTFTTLTIYPPSVQTNSASNITTTGATLSGDVTFDGNTTVTARGFMYGTDANNLTQNVQSGSGTGSFTKALTGLSSSTTYYYKAYATNTAGTAYGDVMTFTTLNDYYSDPTGYTNGHGYVDLGLPSGTKWATCNVGASTPTDYGNYYAWGETTPKSTYTEDNYTYSDNPDTLPSSRDAATANWGSGWRMPTYDEMNELKNNCTVTWTTQNGVNGRLFTGPNGNSIFLPAAGHRYDSSSNGPGFRGYYWSSSFNSVSTDYEWGLYFSSDNYYMYGNYRCNGLSVRAVCQSQN